jgi:hypothetical protein
MYDTESYPHIEMTSLEPWDPYTDCLGNDKHQLAISGNKYLTPNEITRIVSSISTDLRSISNSFDDVDFLSLVRNRVIVSVTNTTRKGTIVAKELAEKWFIELNTAQRTIEQSTQRGVRDFAFRE